MDIRILAETMCILFSTIIVGYIVYHLGILTEDANKKLSELIVDITSPAMIIGSVCNQTADNKSEVLQIFLIGIALYLFYIIFAKAAVIPLRLNKKDSKLYELMLIFMNNSFIGYPIFRVLYGETAVFYASILHMPFNVLIYSYGVYMINGGKTDTKNLNVKNILNPGVISSIIALVIYMMQIPVPRAAAATINMIGDSTIPLSMMLIGASLATVPVKNVLTSYKIYILSIIKLIILPAVAFFIISFITNNNFIIGMVTVSAGLPAGSLIVMLASTYNGNVKDSSVGVFLTTFLSVITIPFMVYLFLM